MAATSSANRRVAGSRSSTVAVARRSFGWCGSVIAWDRPGSPNSSLGTGVRGLPLAGAELRDALLHLLGGDVLDVAHHVPAMTPRVLELPGPVAVELVLDRLQLLGTPFERVREGLV